MKILPGRGRLIDARGIKQAIEQTKREREALLQAASRMAGTQETGSPVTLPDEDEEMEIEESPEHTNVCCDCCVIVHSYNQLISIYSNKISIFSNI